MIEAALTPFLLSAPSVSSLISHRFYELNLPESAVPTGITQTIDPTQFPAVTMRRISTTPQYTMDGSLGLTQSRIQIDVYAATFLAANTVADAIRSLLDFYSGNMNGIYVALITRDDQSSGFDEYTRTPYVQTDWLVLYSE